MFNFPLSTLTPERSQPKENATATAVVYCEANFGAIDGKTANGLVRFSEKYEILSIIDSEQAGLDSGAGRKTPLLACFPNLSHGHFSYQY